MNFFKAGIFCYCSYMGARVESTDWPQVKYYWINQHQVKDGLPYFYYESVSNSVKLDWLFQAFQNYSSLCRTI